MDTKPQAPNWLVRLVGYDLDNAIAVVHSKTPSGLMRFSVLATCKETGHISDITNLYCHLTDGICRDPKHKDKVPSALYSCLWWTQVRTSFGSGTNHVRDALTLVKTKLEQYQPIEA